MKEVEVNRIGECYWVIELQVMNEKGKFYSMLKLPDRVGDPSKCGYGINWRSNRFRIGKLRVEDMETVKFDLFNTGITK